MAMYDGSNESSLITLVYFFFLYPHSLRIALPRVQCRLPAEQLNTKVPSSISVVCLTPPTLSTGAALHILKLIPYKKLIEYTMPFIVSRAFVY